MADMGLNASKRKEQKNQNFLSDAIKKTKEMAETILKNMSACNQ